MAENTTNYVEEKVEKIKSVITKISDNLEITSAYSPYIKFRIGRSVAEKDSKDTEDKTMEFDTLSGLGKSGDRNNDSHYIMQAEVKKYGLNMANAFKIRLAFVADYINDMYNDKEYISLNDKILHNNTVFQKFDNSILFQDFELRYGYTFNVDGKMEFLLSPTYRGTIIKYSMEILNGYVMYDLEGVSGLCKFNESTISLSSSELKDLAGKGTSKKGNYNPVKMLISLLEEYIEANNLDYKVIDNINGNGGPGCEADGKSNPDLMAIFNEPPNGVHIIDYIREVLPKCRAKEQWNYRLASQYTEEEISDDSKHKYVSNDEYIEFFFTVEDDVENGEKLKIIFDYKPKKNPKGKNDDSDLINFDFEWLSGDKKGLILNFLPEFNGALYFGYMGGLQSKIKNAMEKIYGARYYSYVIDNNGGMEKVIAENTAYNDLQNVYTSVDEIKSPTEILTGADTSAFGTNDSGKESASETADYIYNSYKLKDTDDIISGLVATPDMSNIIEIFGTVEGLASATQAAKLQTVGIPANIPLTTKIRIKPIVNNRIHFTAGDYIITGINDSISQAGYITNFDLFRNPDDYNFENLLEEYLNTYEKGRFAPWEIAKVSDENSTNYDYYQDLTTARENFVGPLSGDWDYGIPNELLNN